MLKLPTSKELLDFFFEASMATYASGAKAQSSTALPGGKEYTYERDNLRYVDRYVSGQLGNRGQSAGHTYIEFLPESRVLWIAGYDGWWLKPIEGFEVIHDVNAFHRRALMAAYENRTFLCGRGPEEFTEGIYTYHNEAEEPLMDENHHEWIHAKIHGDTRLVFEHFCFQRTLVELPRK